jgi:hypothetical protein
MLMKSWSNTISLNNPATGWSGFVPDFVKLMSNELVFAYEIIDLNHVCSVELVEAFRASHRSKGPTCSADTDSYVLLYCVATWCTMELLVRCCKVGVLVLHHGQGLLSRRPVSIRARPNHHYGH